MADEPIVAADPEPTLPPRAEFLSSTFSLMALEIVTAYVGLCVWVKDVNGLKELAAGVVGAYIYKKAHEVAKGNG